MNYDLPKSVMVGGKEYAIRSDFRAALDICAALADPELFESDRGLVALTIFYPNYDTIPREDIQEALEKCSWFLNAGEEDRGTSGPRLVDWEQDFPIICAPINRVLGVDIRGMEYLHFWSFVSAYMEIGGECTFAQVVSIRDKQARGKKLDKADREFYRRNKDLVDFKRRYTEEDDDLLRSWI